MTQRSIKPNCFQGRSFIPRFNQIGLIPYFGRNTLRLLSLRPLNFQQNRFRWSDAKATRYAQKNGVAKQSGTPCVSRTHNGEWVWLPFPWLDAPLAALGR